MKTLSLQAFIIAAFLATAATAHSASYPVYVPTSASVGGVSAEVYVVSLFDMHEGLSGDALADASMNELSSLLGGDMDGITLEYRGTSALIRVDREKAKDPVVRDRTLGAVYHTLRLCGFDDIRVDGDANALTNAAFTRGAFVPVIPMHAALPPRRLTYGFIDVAGTLVAPKKFYQDVSVGASSVKKAMGSLLATGTPAVKLSILDGLDSIRLKERIKLMVPRLSEPSVEVRLKVLGMLRDVREPRVLKALEKVVNADESPQAKLDAARILVNAGKKQFEKYLLLEKLRSRDDAEIVSAAKALIEIGDKRLAPAMGRLVQHSSPQVRAAGLEALKHFSLYGQMSELLRDDKLNRDVSVPMAQHLARDARGQEQSAGIIWLLSKGDRAEAKEAAEIAGDKRVAGTTEGLGGALKRTEPEVREAAAKALARLRDPAGLEFLADAIGGTSAKKEQQMLAEQAIAILAVQPLSQVLQIAESPDVTIRELTVKALAEFVKESYNAQVVSKLKAYMGDSEPAIKQAAAYALARIKNRGVVDELLKYKADSDPLIRHEIAHALAYTEHPDAEATLLQFLADRDNQVKQRAVKAARERGMKSAFNKIKNLVEARHSGIRREVIQAVIALADPADKSMFDIYASRLYDREADIRFYAVQALMNFALDPRTTSVVGGVVIDKDVRVKVAALKVLAASGDANAIEQVVRGLFDSSEGAKAVKLAALDALQNIGHKKAKKPLKEFIANEGDAEVRKRAEEVLGAL